MKSVERFLRAVHRRWIVVRLFERAGIGILVGCGVAALLLPVMIWRGDNAAPVIAIFLSIGALAGLGAGWLRKPSALSAAMEADRQLSQDDLLATALLTGSHRDEWSIAVLALAEARCRMLAPNAIVLHRLGARAWGGIGLSVAMLFTIALMFAQPDASSAGRARASAQRRNISPQTSSKDTAAPSLASESTERRRTERAADARRRAVDAQSSDATGASARQSSPGSSRTRADESARGAGAAQSDDAAVATPRNDDRNTSATAAVEGGRDAAGGGGGSLAGESGESVATGVASPTDTSRTPPWQHAEWRGDRAAAEEALRGRSVPDGYRDVVRAYFDVEDNRAGNASSDDSGTR
jgi:hypothetical protein